MVWRENGVPAEEKFVCVCFGKCPSGGFIFARVKNNRLVRTDEKWALFGSPWLGIRSSWSKIYVLSSRVKQAAIQQNMVGSYKLETKTSLKIEQEIEGESHLNISELASLNSQFRWIDLKDSMLPILISIQHSKQTQAMEVSTDIMVPSDKPSMGTASLPSWNFY